MAAPGDPVPYVMIGFGAGVLADLDPVLPAGSVRVVDDAGVIAARHVRERAARLPCVAEVVEAPTQDPGALDAVLAAAGVGDATRAVLPGLEYGVAAAAAIAEAAGLPGAGTRAARALRDKVELRRAGTDAALPQPDWAEIGGPQELRAFRDAHGGECVLKPATLQASVGVQLLGPADDPVAAWRLTSAASEPDMLARRRWPDRFLVEERMYGPELSAEVLVARGEVCFANVTAKQVMGGRFPVETGHLVPAPLPPSGLAAVRAANQALVRAIGFGDGVLHSEWILAGPPEDPRPRLVECAGRLPGDDIVRLIDLAYGGSIALDLLHVLEGRPPERDQIARAGAAVHFLSAAPGTVTRVEGIEAARAQEGVQDVVIGVQAGSVQEPVTNSWQRPGRLVTVGPDAATAQSRAERAAALISIVVERDGAPLGGSALLGPEAR